MKLHHLLLALSLAPAASADIFWTGAVSGDIFDEANWDLSQSQVTVIDPNVSIDDNVVIRDAPADVILTETGGGQFRFQLEEGRSLIIDNSRLVAAGNDGVGCFQGTQVGITIEVNNGASFEPYFVVNRVRVKIDATSTAIFGGPGDPLNIATVDMNYGSVLAFLTEDPSEFLTEHLGSVTVAGVPATAGGNVNIVSDGNQGSIVTVIPQTVGTSYCMANPNSTGVPSLLTGLGSDLVASNSLTLECSSMPPGSFAFFLTSQTQGFASNPGGSDGNLCLGGAIGRYVGPGQIQQAGAAGTVSLALDLNQIPSPTGFVAASAGDTWNFQTWFRDSNPQGQAVSNFSMGLEVTLQ
jgi:hypothetical protein